MVQPARWIRAGRDGHVTGEFVAAVAGLLIGLLMGLLLGLPLAKLPGPYGLLLPLGVSIVLGLGMMGLTVAKREDLRQGPRELGVRRVRVPSTRSRPGPAGPTSIVDTSAIIDGRLVDVVASGFLWGAWSCRGSCWVSCSTSRTTPTPGERSRGRRGLEVLSVLQKDHRIRDLELRTEDGPRVGGRRQAGRARPRRAAARS